MHLESEEAFFTAVLNARAAFNRLGQRGQAPGALLLGNV